jgi:Holliday junction DNA helicase RuvB
MRLRIITRSIMIDDLRPSSLDDFGGQDDLVRELRVVLNAAIERGELTDHICFAGPPGLGKTTLAGIIANELKLPIHVTSGPALEKPSDVVSLLSGLRSSSVVFIDEIHRLPRACEEILYPAMEDGLLDIVVGEGAKTRTVRLPLPKFVLIGATTQIGLLSSPFRDRFGFVGRVKLYTNDHLAKIVSRSAAILDMNVTLEGSYLIASRSRGTPRVANKWLRRVRDWAQLQGHDVVDEVVANAALGVFGVDAVGLDSLGRELLITLIQSFGGGPVGLSTLAAALGETTNTIEEVYEPFLMRQGFLMRTPRGRMATVAACEHLGIEVPSKLLGGSENS